MQKRIHWITGLAVVLIFLSACATPPERRLKESGRLKGIPIGLKKRHLLARLGTDVMKVYDTEGKIRTIVTNPYETEKLRSEDAEREAVFYFTNPQRRDGPIQSDELTPFIFENGKLTGIGWVAYHDAGGHRYQ